MYKNKSHENHILGSHGFFLFQGLKTNKRKEIVMLIKKKEYIEKLE